MINILWKQGNLHLLQSTDGKVFVGAFFVVAKRQEKAKNEVRKSIEILCVSY